MICLLAGLVGAAMGWGARQVAGISSTRARQAATRWLEQTMRYSEVEVLGMERRSNLAGYDGPVWLVSVKAGSAYKELYLTNCLGVVVGARTGAVHGAEGGHVAWLKCQ